jgi:hypothetical protein
LAYNYSNGQSRRPAENLKTTKMKTLNLISKANRRNYFFGERNAKGQEVIASFNSANDLHIWMNEKAKNRDGIEMSFFKNELFMSRIIKAEYSQARTYFHRFEFNNLDYCIKIFNEKAK